MEYKAFISYRHAPADIAVARQIQRELERFRIPKVLQQRLGIQKLGRVFRDQEELAITSDLSQTISDALDHAEFLIVICSTATAQSTWVTREIRQFLRTHDLSHVLTVLVNGEPGEVIPKELFHETVTVEENGVMVTRERERELLSCDYRKAKKSERRAELLRLAAPLLGCGYDELAMRERQYRRRRAMTAALVAGSLAAVAIGYLVWSLFQIRTNYERAEENYALAQENYIQALQSQSEYLSSASLSALDSGDRALALHLALAALPGEDEERAVLPVTEDALSQAVEAYVPEKLTMFDYRQVWNFRMPGQIADWVTDAEGKTLYALDEYGNLAMWDLETFREKAVQTLTEPKDTSDEGIRRSTEQYLQTFEEGFRTLRYPGDGNLYCASNVGALFAMDPETCAGRWTRTIRDFQNRQGGIVSDAEWIYTETGPLCVVTVILSSEDSEEKSYELRVLSLSPEDGSVVWESEWFGGLSGTLLHGSKLSEAG